MENYTLSFSLRLFVNLFWRAFHPTIALYTAFTKVSNDFQVTKSMYFSYLYLDLLAAGQHVNILYMKNLDTWFPRFNTLLFFSSGHSCFLHPPSSKLLNLEFFKILGLNTTDSEVYVYSANFFLSSNLYINYLFISFLHYLKELHKHL